MKNGYKVAAYLRLSVEDGDKEVSDSIVSQKSIIEEKIKKLGREFELYDFYIDDGYTGLNTDRPSFQRMIEDLNNGIVNTVITKDLSRLSSNSYEANYLIELYFLERNIRYIIQKNNNSEIAKIKGKGNAVSIKSVVMFLADKIEEALKI